LGGSKTGAGMREGIVRVIGPQRGGETRLRKYMNKRGERRWGETTVIKFVGGKKKNMKAFTS